LNEAFEQVRKPTEKEQARQKLEEAFSLFDDLSLGANDPIFQSDRSKPFRSWPHERVLASTLLAALDAEAGRCDLALPALKDALRVDAFWHSSGQGDATLPALLGIYCAHALGYNDEADFYKRRLYNALVVTVLNGEVSDKKQATFANAARVDKDALERKSEAMYESAKQGLHLIFAGRDAKRQDPMKAFFDSPLEIVLGAPVGSGQLNEVWSSYEQVSFTKRRAFDENLKWKSIFEVALSTAALAIGQEGVYRKAGSDSLRLLEDSIDSKRDERRVRTLFSHVWWITKKDVDSSRVRIAQEH